MPWKRFVGAIILYLALVKGINWAFISLRLDKNIAERLPFILSNIFAILIILSIMIIQLQKRRRLIS